MQSVFPRRIISVLICAVLFGFALQASMYRTSVSSKKNVFAVVDASSGLPLSGVQVTASGSGGFGYANTDNNGQFNITNGLMSGNYTAVASQQGYLNAENDSIMVTARSEVSGVTLYMSLSGGIFGRVADSISHIGLMGRSISAYLFNGTGTYYGLATTDSSGNYSIFTNLGTGTYNVSIFSPEGYVGKTIGPITVTAGTKTTGIDLYLQRSGIISGRITTPGGQGLANLTVTAYDQMFSNFGAAQTNATGFYRIASGLAASNYTVTVSSGLNINSTAQPPLDAVYPTGVIVTVGQETPNVNLELTIAAPQPSGTIMGTVMYANNHPIPYAQVTATGDTHFSYESATADQNGNYAISQNLVNDTYTVTASANGYQNQNFTGVSVVENQVTTVNFHLQTIPASQSGRISGTVNGDSNPITPEFRYPLAMMLIATLVAVAIAKSSSRKTKYTLGLQKNKT
jgi:hypothetical protein